MTDTAPTALGTPAYQDAANAQAVAADPTISAWVAANAGSGKTKVLIDRVARLLLAGAKPAAILCITYTRAAANEMITRLFDRLGAWSVMGDAQLAAELAKLEGRQAASYETGELRRARALFAQALETPGGLRIETVHAFSARLLRRFPLEAQVPPGFRDLEDADTARLFDVASMRALSLLDREAPDQLDRVTLEGGGLGAGAALSLIRSATSNLADLVRLEDPQIRAALRAALGAPDMAVAELLEKVLITDWPSEAYADVIGHLRTGSTNDQKLATRLEAIMVEPNLQKRWDGLPYLWTKTDGARRDKNIFTKKMPPPVSDLIGILPPKGREITRLEAVADQIRAAQAVDRTMDLIALARPTLARFQREKRLEGALDFDDLIERARSLVSQAGVSDWIRYKLDGEIEHVLLDEAQDTAPNQWDILDALTNDFFAGASAHAERSETSRTLFVVGDEKQSIYSFQGADERVFLTGRQDFIASAGEASRTPDMKMSFRSSPEILSFVDAVFNQPRLDVGLSSLSPPIDADVLEHAAFRAGQGGGVELLPIEPPLEAKENTAWHAPVDTDRETSPKAQLAKTIAERVRTMVDKGEAVWADGGTKRRPVTPGDVLILVRGRRSGLFDALIRALKDQGLPVAGADRLVLSDHIGVQDCLNLVRFALFPSDDLTLAEILRGPFCGLTDDDEHLFPLAFGRGDTSLWECVQHSEHPDVAPARTFLETVLASADLPAFEFLSAVLDQAICNGATGWERMGTRLGMPARDPIEALLARAVLHDANEGASLRRFLNAMDCDGSDIKRDLAEAGGSVRVMTVHGAKGLQAPVVILPDTTAGPKATGASLLNIDALPVWGPRKGEDCEAMAAARERLAERSLSEERRLLYVALTRAEDRLIIAGTWRAREKETGYHPQSWYALCRGGLEHLGVEGLKDTEPVIWGQVPEYAEQTNTQPSQRTTDIPAWLYVPAPAEAVVLPTLSPSQLFTEQASTIDPLTAPGPDRRLRGRVIHTLLERLPSLPEAEREETARLYLSRIDALEEKMRVEIQETTLNTLAFPDFADIFGPDSRPEVEIVGEGTGLLQGRTLAGRIDRLLVSDEQVLIIDIKTDQPPPQSETGVETAYLAQLAAYQNALQPAYPNQPVRCAILWTDGPRLMPISDSVMLVALKSSLSRL